MPREKKPAAQEQSWKNKLSILAKTSLLGAMDPLERQIRGYHSVSWEMWEFTVPQEFLRVLETELLLMANWFKWCKHMMSLPLAEP